MDYHLAQVNIAVPRYALDTPEMYGFTSRLKEVNELAEATDGFVWRFTGDDAEMTLEFGSSELLVNLSVWNTIDALAAFSYSGTHRDVFRGREQWFEKAKEANFALWWIPAGHLPTPAEAKARIDYLRQHGPTETAFTFAKRFPAPSASQTAGA